MSLCGVLTPDQLTDMQSIASNLSFRRLQTIYQEGDAADYVSNVTAGAVRLYKLLPDGRRQITGFLFPGDFLGIAMNDSYAYTAEAMADTRLCQFPRRRLQALMAKYPNLEHELLGLACNELAAAQDQMLLLGRKSAEEKIASFLLKLSERALNRGRPGDPVHLPMSRADMADYLGLTTETVSRTLTSLKTRNIITLKANGYIALTGHDDLEYIADGV